MIPTGDDHDALPTAERGVCAHSPSDGLRVYGAGRVVQPRGLMRGDPRHRGDCGDLRLRPARSAPNGQHGLLQAYVSRTTSANGGASTPPEAEVVHVPCRTMLRLAELALLSKCRAARTLTDPRGEHFHGRFLRRANFTDRGAAVCKSRIRSHQNGRGNRLRGETHHATSCATGSAIAAVVGAVACSSQIAPMDPVATTSAAVSATASTAGEKNFTAFESGQVRPLALSDDSHLLFATNTPDNRLEIFRVDGPVQCTVRSPLATWVSRPSLCTLENNEVRWVVNHLSDSASASSDDQPSPENARLVRTLLVGDEPRDIVFAGKPGHRRAFVTTAHRGQNTGRDPQLTTPGAGRADVWVFDAGRPDATMGGTPAEVLTFFADTPRALAVTPDGATVYAAAFQSGNRSTSVSERIVTPTGVGLPPPNTNYQAAPQPPVGLIVKYRPDPNDGVNCTCLDSAGRQWDDHVEFNLPDKDVFAIDAASDPPAAKSAGVYTGVGTVLFGMAVNPVSGKVYVSNTDAQNQVRFEGHDAFGVSQGVAPGTVIGHIAESRITVIDPAAGTVTPVT